MQPLTGYRDKTLRPEQDACRFRIQLQAFSKRTTGKFLQLNQESKSIIVEALKAEIRPGIDLLDIAANINTNIMTRLHNVQASRTNVVLQDQPKGKDSRTLDFSVVTSIQGSTQGYKSSVIWVSEWTPELSIGSQERKLLIRIATEENLPPSVIEKERDRGYNVLESHRQTKRPSLGIHEKALRKALDSTYSDIKSLGQEVVNCAFQSVESELSHAAELQNMTVRIFDRKQRNEPLSSLKETIDIARSYSQFKAEGASVHLAPRIPGVRTAFIALGSNLGNRYRSIEAACRELSHKGIRVVRCSNLYETKPMYLEDQPSFLNAVCEVRKTTEQSQPKPFHLQPNARSIQRTILSNCSTNFKTLKSSLVGRKESQTDLAKSISTSYSMRMKQ